MNQPNRHYKRGDVILVLFPNSDLISAKRRPALVVQNDNLHTGIQQVIVAMITSQMFRANHPSRITVRLNTDEGKRSGLLTDSVVMTDNLATTLESAIDRSIGDMKIDAIDIALKHTLGIR
ncbi:MAG: type II toxin-antitoxin system PemK/MazF family toxin [Caldilineaceae bacterium]